MNARRDLLRNNILYVIAIAAVPPIVWLATSFGDIGRLAVVGVVGLTVGIYVGIRHPLWFYWGLAAVMATLTFGRFPGLGLPLYLPLAFGALLASLIHPRLARSPHPIELAVYALVAAAAVSVVATGPSLLAISLFLRWAIATLTLISLLQLSPEHLARFGRIYVYGASLNALIGLYIIAFDRGLSIFRPLQIFGYSPDLTVGFYAYTDDGASRSFRLGGLWVEPNGAGFGLLAALLLCVLLFTGWRRVLLATLLASAMMLTLSRQAIGTVLLGVILVLIFHSMRSRDRLATIGTIALAVTVSLLVPPVRRRILTSFRSDDAGSTSRVDSLQAFPDQLAGHWTFGLGWARQEFFDPVYSFAINIVSNAPLLTIYRGGIIVGAAFIFILVMCLVVGYRALRSNSLPLAFYGGVMIVYVFELQVDHGVVDVPQGALLFSVLLAFLVYVDRSRKESERPAHLTQSDNQGPTAEALTRTR